MTVVGRSWRATGLLRGLRQDLALWSQLHPACPLRGADFKPLATGRADGLGGGLKGQGHRRQQRVQQDGHHGHPCTNETTAGAHVMKNEPGRSPLKKTVERTV